MLCSTTEDLKASSFLHVHVWLARFLEYSSPSYQQATTAARQKSVYMSIYKGTQVPSCAMAVICCV